MYLILCRCICKEASLDGLLFLDVPKYWALHRYNLRSNAKPHTMVIFNERLTYSVGIIFWGVLSRSILGRVVCDRLKKKKRHMVIF